MGKYTCFYVDKYDLVETLLLSYPKRLEKFGLLGFCFIMICIVYQARELVI